MLSRAAALLREALGPKQRILLTFDCGGSFPEQMAQLRDDGFEFVTYELRPNHHNDSRSAFSVTHEHDAV